MEHHIDVIMYLVFEGVVETTTKLIQAWAGMVDKQSFLEKVENRLNDIFDLNLSWCKVEPYRYVHLDMPNCIIALKPYA